MRSGRRKFAGSRRFSWERGSQSSVSNSGQLGRGPNWVKRTAMLPSSNELTNLITLKIMTESYTGNYIFISKNRYIILLGIEGNISRWIKAFLSEPTQRVCVDVHLSTKADVKSGVPQGTMLGLLLFLCFINDLPLVVHPDTQVRLFNDDCLVYRSISSTENQLKFQEDLHSLATWGLQWGMRFDNTDKCHILTVSASAQPLSKLYEIDGSFLQHVDTVTYIGIIIHRTLEFADHITEAVSKANKKLGFLKRNPKGCPSELKKTATSASSTRVLSMEPRSGTPTWRQRRRP